jgi:hypothetical protein
MKKGCWRVVRQLLVFLNQFRDGHIARNMFFHFASTCAGCVWCQFSLRAVGIADTYGEVFSFIFTHRSIEAPKHRSTHPRTQIVQPVFAHLCTLKFMQSGLPECRFFSYVFVHFYECTCISGRFFDLLPRGFRLVERRRTETENKEANIRLVESRSPAFRPS